MKVTWRSTAAVRNCIGVFLICLVSSVIGVAQEVNVVKSVKSVDSTVEIELHSSKAFPIRDEVVVLRIGNKEFYRSKHPENGSLNTLIFMLSAKEFAALADGQAMTVKFGRGDDQAGEMQAARQRGEPRWDFGKLDKRLLDR
jgi:hypothetical protein